MKKGREIINLLHENLKVIEDDDLSDGSFFYLDKKTGEMIEVAERFEGHSAYLIAKIKKGINARIPYITMSQKGLEEAMMNLKGGEIMVLFYFIGKMSYDNAVYGVTYRGISKKLGVSVRTVTTIVNRLLAKNLIKRFGDVQTKVYYVNPSIAWKGSKVNMRKKAAMFLER